MTWNDLDYLLIGVLKFDMDFLMAGELALSDNKDILILLSLPEEHLTPFVFLEVDTLQKVINLLLCKIWEYWDISQELQIPSFNFLFNFA